MDETTPDGTTPEAPRLPERRRHGVVGYTAGVFDMFHAGHLHLLKQARGRCDYLIVGVTTDEMAMQARGRMPVVPMLERMAVVESMRYVDHVIPQINPDKVYAWQTYKYDVLFAGDNLRGDPEWTATREHLAELGVRLEFLPATYTRTGHLRERGLAALVAE
jgi:cytidyltransferase-like protein